MTTPSDRPSDELPGMEPLGLMGQGLLFDPKPLRSRLTQVTCPCCSASFKVHPSVARTFRRCSACRLAGLEALELGS